MELAGQSINTRSIKIVTHLSDAEDMGYVIVTLFYV